MVSLDVINDFYLSDNTKYLHNKYCKQLFHSLISQPSKKILFARLEKNRMMFVSLLREYDKINKINIFS